MNTGELTLLSFVAGFVGGTFTFLVGMPYLGLAWGLEAAGIAFIGFFVLALMFSLAFYSNR